MVSGALFHCHYADSCSSTLRAAMMHGTFFLFFLHAHVRADLITRHFRQVLSEITERQPRPIEPVAPVPRAAAFAHARSKAGVARCGGGPRKKSIFAQRFDAAARGKDALNDSPTGQSTSPSTHAPSHAERASRSHLNDGRDSAPCEASEGRQEPANTRCPSQCRCGRGRGAGREPAEGGAYDPL